MQTHTNSGAGTGSTRACTSPSLTSGWNAPLFFFVWVAAVGAFNLFNSLLAGLVVFVGGFVFGTWVTNADPALLRILARPISTTRVMTPRNKASLAWR